MKRLFAECMVFFVSITMISRLDCLHFSNATDCGPSQYQSEDGDRMPCSQVCSTNQKKSHKDMCTFLCPNFKISDVITNSPQTSPVVKRDISTIPVQNKHNNTVVALICVIVVVVLCIFFMLMRKQCRLICRRTNKNFPEPSTIPIQETQSLSNTESDEEKEESISIESIGNTWIISEV